MGKEMTESAIAEIKEQVRQRVCTLFRAENGPRESGDNNYIPAPNNTAKGIRGISESILANDYLPIIRGKGQVDRDREETLAKIEAGSPGFVRHVDRAEIHIDLISHYSVAIVRSLLPTTDSRETPAASVAYRNLQVFLNTDSGWQCIAWQVTKVQ